MASCISNSLSLQGRKRSPNCLFGWNIGRKRGDNDDKPQIKYHDIDLTFSTSLVSKTFLKGISSLVKLVTVKILNRGLKFSEIRCRSYFFTVQE